MALADPIRRGILSMLRSASLPAGRIANAFSVSRPAVSRHLRVLREAGLVRDRNVGRERHYQLELAPLNEIEALIAELRAPAGTGKETWERRLMALETEVYRVRGRSKPQGALTERNRKRKTA